MIYLVAIFGVGALMLLYSISTSLMRLVIVQAATLGLYQSLYPEHAKEAIDGQNDNVGE